MLPLPLLAEHLAALAVVWGVALLTGTPLGRLGRWRLGPGGAALLGVAFWAVALYCFPFRNGLLVATGGVAVLWLLCGRARGMNSPRVFSTQYSVLSTPIRAYTLRSTRVSTSLLVLGCLSFLTLPLCNYVPPGMDASMHATAARLIAAHGGLPGTYAPFAPDIRFPAVNLGLPALAAVAIRCGCSPASVILAAEHLTCCCVLLSAWLLLRLVARRTHAAVLALFAVWGSHTIQASCNWGGFPTAMSLALGLLATRMLVDLSRRPAVPRALTLGLVLGAMPLVHGISAAVWLYVAAPVAGLFTLHTCKRRSPYLKTLAGAAAVAGLIMLAYLGAGQKPMSPATLAWIRECQAGLAPTGEGWQLLREALARLVSLGGQFAVLAGTLAALVLLLRRRFAAFAIVGTAGLLLTLLMINSRLWVLPGSALLYPDRMSMWAAPLAALALALAWPARTPAVATTGLAAVLLVGAAIVHGQSFQRFACRPYVTRGEWEALCWAEGHLDPGRDYVESRYHTAGAYLPPVAGVGCSGWHYHIFCQEEVSAALDGRPRTHAFFLRRREAGPLPPGRVVFQNADVAIVELKAKPRPRKHATVDLKRR